MKNSWRVCVCVCASFFRSFYTLICHLLLLFSLYHSPSDGVGVSGTFETIFSIFSSLPFLLIPTYAFFSSLFPFFFANHSLTLSFIISIQLFFGGIWVNGMRRGEQSRELGYGMRARVARIFSSHLWILIRNLCWSASWVGRMWVLGSNIHNAASRADDWIALQRDFSLSTKRKQANKQTKRNVKAAEKLFL